MNNSRPGITVKWDIVDDVVTSSPTISKKIGKRRLPSAVGPAATSAAVAVLFFGLISGSTPQVEVSEWTYSATSLRVQTQAAETAGEATSSSANDASDAQIGMSPAELAESLVPFPFNTPLKRLVSKEMSRFDRDYPW